MPQGEIFDVEIKFSCIGGVVRMPASYVGDPGFDAWLGHLSFDANADAGKQK